MMEACMILSWIIFLFLAAAVVCGVLSGRMDAVAAAVSAGAGQGVELVLGLAGVICLWSALSEVLEAVGLSRWLARRMRPLLRQLFPAASGDPGTLEAISANVTANLLGLGNAATPLGIRAVQRMRDPANPLRATDEMCRFIVLNTASIQLLPTTVAAIRAGAGAQRPFDILPCVLITSLCSVVFGEGVAFLFSKWSRS